MKMVLEAADENNTRVSYLLGSLVHKHYYVLDKQEDS